MDWHYGWGRAWAHLRRTWRSGLGTLVMLMAILAVLGMVGLLAVNVEHLGRLWLSNTTLSLFLKSEIDDGGRKNLLAQIRQNPVVQHAQLISPKEGLQQLAERLGADHALMQGLDETALPYAIDVDVTVDYRKRLGEVARQFRVLPGVEDVVYSERLLDKVQAFFTVVQWVGTAFVALVAVAFCLIVAQATGLSLYARREEIEILDLIGATRGMVRSAFVLESVFIALGAWIAALVLVALSFLAIRQVLNVSPLAPWVQGQAVFLPWPTWTVAGLAAILLSAVSSAWSVTRLLRELTP